LVHAERLLKRDINMKDTDPITQVDLKQLAAPQEEHCISLLMPTHRAGRATRQDPIRLKNLIRQARDSLVRLGHAEGRAESLLKPASALLDDETFWPHQGHGLAVYLTKEQCRHYRTDISLPELCLVQDRFYVVPLLPIATGNQRFLMLAFSPNRVRLLEGNRHEIHEPEVPDMPKNFGELGRYIDSEKQLQFHTETPAGGPGTERPGVFFGQGGGGADSSERKQRLVEFARIIDRAWQRGGIDTDEGRVPLYLACDKSLVALYREASSYPGLADATVTGNPDDLSAEDLHRQAWSLQAARLAERQREAIAAYQQAESSEQATDCLDTILPAATQGRVARLLVGQGVRQWGSYDPQQQVVKLAESDSNGSQELINLATSESLLTGAEISLIDAEDFHRPIAAVLRY
jgi:hypothetical protein